MRKQKQLCFVYTCKYMQILDVLTNNHWKVARSNILFQYVIPFSGIKERIFILHHVFQNLPNHWHEIWPLCNQWQNELLISVKVGFYHRHLKLLLLRHSPISYSKKFEVECSDSDSNCVPWSTLHKQQHQANRIVSEFKHLSKPIINQLKISIIDK